MRQRQTAEEESIGGSSVKDVFDRAEIVIVMLFDCAAINDVLQRGTKYFAAMARGRAAVNISSISPPDSRVLDLKIRIAGSRRTATGSLTQVTPDHELTTRLV